MQFLVRPCLYRYALICLFAAIVGSYGCRSKKNHVSAPAYDAPQQSFAEELKPYLDSYVIDAAADGAPVDPRLLKELRRLEWKDEATTGSVINSSNLGKCFRLNENHPDPTRRYRVVEITKPDARMMAGKVKIDATTLKVIIYHELGHCLHDFKGHRPDTEDSIMSTTIPKTRYVRLEALIHEHFDLVRN